MPPMFSRANKYQMGSNARTDINQGGGNKKAGFPYIIGRGWRTNIAFGNNVAKGHCTKLKSYQTLCFTGTVHQSRPTGSVNTGSTYWNI
uniref:Uncharacterized protein n=1 Tax=viral metagenome TaxID=1070528 RepID=A0A6C0HY89_9ZZZZ